MDGRMDGWVDGWMNGWVGGWMDGWMDRYPFAGRTEEPVSDARGKTRLSSVISPDHAAEVTAEVLRLFIPTRKVTCSTAGEDG